MYEAVKNNPENLSEIYSFRISATMFGPIVDEIDILSSRSHIATLNKNSNLSYYSINCLPYSIISNG